MKFKRNIMPPLCLILGCILMASCGESDPASVNPQGETPQVPTARSIAFDVSYFDSQQSNPVGGDNYQQAAEAIKPIKSIQKRSIEPIQDLLKSADTTNAKVLQEGKKWEWTVNQKNGLDIQLIATLKKADRIKWKVFVNIPSRTTFRLNQVQKFPFLIGTTNSEVTEGMWKYHLPRAGQPQQEAAKLSWKIQEKGIHMELKVTADMQFQGSTMVYDAENNMRTIILKPVDQTKTTIKYNVKTNVGFIKAPNYNNGQKACWNTNFKDVPCTKINV